MYIYLYACVRMYMYIDIYLHIFIYIYMHVYMYICIYALHARRPRRGPPRVEPVLARAAHGGRGRAHGVHRVPHRRRRVRQAAREAAAARAPERQRAARHQPLPRQL